MFAQVVVDVPARQTDRPFDYRVPSRFAGWLEVGSRVGVPFAGRTLQGFVVALSAHSEVAADKLKPIAELLDPTPPLRPDLIELARWMSEKYGCPWTVALQVMIPTALKGKAERVIRLAPQAATGAATGAGAGVQEATAAAETEASEGAGAEAKAAAHTAAEIKAAVLPEALVRQLQRQGECRLEALLDKQPEWGPAIRAALQSGLLIETVTVKDRLAVRTVQLIRAIKTASTLEGRLAELGKTAVKQRELLSYIWEQDEPQPLPQVLAATGASAATAQALARKGIVELQAAQVSRDPYAGRQFARTAALPLTAGQEQVYRPIAAAVEGRQTAVYLLQGVTGSGKTEVYLQAIDTCIRGGRQAIVLVPEISLTPQMVERFKGRFGEAVAVLHSRLSNGERYDEWRKIKDRRVQVAIGARSAVFAPFEQIGLIIIDEEHETSYKQDESPKYHARDVAVRRARQHGAVVVLGSATPSMESFAAASRQPQLVATRSGKDADRGMDTPGAPITGLLPLRERVGQRPLPPVEVVDMRQELLAGNRSMFSRQLHDALAARLARGEQSVLLLNRRGYSTFVMCRSCGFTAECPHCAIALTFHQKSRLLRCHYCGHAERAPEQCPSCESEHIRFFGTGTQRVEEELARLFPGMRVIRMDVDTTTEKGSHEKWLSQFGERRADVLLGTQMVAKGLDFPYVTLVGVLAADSSLHLPDFRAAEKTFQLLTQVAGRAGRHHLPGEVVVQSYAPEHYAIQYAKNHDFEGFVARELRQRQLRGYPPYCRLVLVTFAHEQLAFLVERAEQFAASLRKLAQQAGVFIPLESGQARAVELYGPVASPIARLKDRYRFQCMIKYRGHAHVLPLIRRAAEPLEAERNGVSISIDVDPQVMM